MKLRTVPRVLALFLFLGAAQPDMASALSIWEIPRGGATADRQGWKPAAPGSSPAGGLALDNGSIFIAARPDSEAVELSSIRSGKPSAGTQLVLSATDGKRSRIQRVVLKESDGQSATIEVAGAGYAASVTVQEGQPIASVQSLGAGLALEIRASWRYVLVPDFVTTQDTVYDPTRLKSGTIAVTSDNFLLGLCGDHAMALMCTWPGALSVGKSASDTAPVSASDVVPKLSLTMTGDGAARRCTSLGIQFRAGPVFLGMLDSDSLWHEMDISGLNSKAPVKLSWTRPFNAQWKAELLASGQQAGSDSPAKSRSWVFLDGQKPGYPVWFSGKAAYLAVPAENSSGDRYDRLVVYAADRQKDTPLSVQTPVDIMRQTLGIGPCEYELDRKQAKDRLAQEQVEAGPSGADQSAPVIEGIPADTPEQAKLRMELRGKGYIYLPRGNRIYRVNPDGTDMRVIMETSVKKQQIPSCQASWDGKYVAAVVRPPWGQTTNEVRLVGYNGGVARTVYSSTNRHSVAWTPDSAWLVILDECRIMALNRETGATKQLLEVELTRDVKQTLCCLSSDRNGFFYFWGDYAKSGNTFSVDKDCNLAKGLFRSDMKQICQPRVSPDGTKMARHEHDYEWLGGNKRGYISEKVAPGGDKFKNWYYFPKNDDMPFRGWMDAPFWSPDGEYLAYVYKPDIEALKKSGFDAKKGYSVIAICRTAGGPMVWLAPGGADLFPSWGPVPGENHIGERK